MRYTWDEAERQINPREHGLDFADAEKAFASPVVLFEDERADYGEQSSNPGTHHGLNLRLTGHM